MRPLVPKPPPLTWVWLAAGALQGQHSWGAGQAATPGTPLRRDLLFLRQSVCSGASCCHALPWLLPDPQGGPWQVAEQELPSAGHRCQGLPTSGHCVLGWGAQVWELLTPDPEFSGLHPPFLSWVASGYEEGWKAELWAKSRPWVGSPSSLEPFPWLQLRTGGWVPD